MGLIPTLIPLLKDLNPLYIHLLTDVVHVLEAFMDYSNPAVTSFRVVRNLDSIIACLKLEVCHLEKKIRKQSGEGRVLGDYP